jgi:hypothetical protein
MTKNNQVQNLSRFLVVLIVLFVLLIFAFFVFSKVLFKDDNSASEEVIIEPPSGLPEQSPVEEAEEVESLHQEELPVSTIFDEKSEDKVSISGLTISKPVNVNGAYTLDSGPNFRGYFQNRAYVLSAGGQFYYYDTKKNKTFTYENFVREAFVDDTTGNVLFTRENIEQEGKFSVYRASKEYPVKEAILDIPGSSILENVTFFKDFALLYFYDNSKYTPFVKVVPMKDNKLSPLGSQLNGIFNVNITHTVTDGKRLIGFDSKSNSIVELTNGVPKTLFQLKEEIYGLSLDVYGKTVLTSFSSMEGEGQLLLNGKPIVNKPYSEIKFFNEDYAFLNTGETLELIQTTTKRIEFLDYIVYNLSVTKNALYYSSDTGDIKKIEIRKATK